uniref:Uncharacterized protein n=1 Tax=Myoviridae sp. ctiBE32 TaxID=2826685 RepID=A0A8S5N770_9CAUD|nr:MAG TPA: hypothetical protein [Myoviridae sp. ctiBE32]
MDTHSNGRINVIQDRASRKRVPYFLRPHFSTMN